MAILPHSSKRCIGMSVLRSRGFMRHLGNIPLISRKMVKNDLRSAASTRAFVDRAYRSRSGTVGALYEGLNECQAGNSPPDTGGVAAPSRKMWEATAVAQTGWLGLPKCFGMRSLKKVPFPTTPSAPIKEASQLLIDVASTPPMSGGEWRAQFIHPKCRPSADIAHRANSQLR